MASRGSLVQEGIPEAIVTHPHPKREHQTPAQPLFPGEVVRPGGEAALVQCKHWRSKQVGVGVVRELLGSMTALDAKAGSVVTSGRFTAEAERFAADQGLELLDGESLRSKFGDVLRSRGAEGKDVREERLQ